MSALSGAVVTTVVAPALAAAVGLVLGRRSRPLAVGCAVGGTAVALAAALVQLLITRDGAVVTGVPLLGEVATGDVLIGLDLRGDALAALVAVAVGSVALAVQVYSTAYLPGAGTPDAPTRFPAYAATVSLFTAAMLLVVHADDLVLLLVGWEVMGLASYLLVGHHSEREAARRAAVKAFLVTRVGDVGFTLGIVVLLVGAGTSSVTELLGLASTGDVPGSTWTAATLLLLAGVVGKSAQFPLHTWLPDAMEGPTPVSALIHAATMVAAGVYVVSRLHPVFELAPVTLAVMAVIASVTMLGAALAALTQDDLKRLLAWSTISQVAYMLAALAVADSGAGPAAGLAHLLSHAGFKALLFLAAGCVAVLTGSTLLSHLGGVRRSSPVLAVCLAVGLAALAGLPPLSGFWSKEAVLSAAERAALHPEQAAGFAWAAWLVLAAGMATTLVTGAYAARAFAVVVLGPDVYSGGHRVPMAMTAPVVLLAVATVAGPLVILDLPAPLAGAGVSAVTAVIATAMALAGVAVGLAAARRPDRDVALLLPDDLRLLLANGFRLDDATRAVAVRPVVAAARMVRAGDRDVVDAYARATALGARWAGVALRRTQSGVVTGYLTWLVAGAVVLGVAGLVLT